MSREIISAKSQNDPPIRSARQEYQFLYESNDYGQSQPSSNERSNPTENSDSPVDGNEEESYEVEIVEDSFGEEGEDEMEELEDSDQLEIEQISQSDGDTAQFAGSTNQTVTTPTIKQPIANLNTANWQILAEKVAGRLIMKDLLTQISTVNEIFSLQQSHHEDLLKMPNYNLTYPSKFTIHQIARKNQQDRYRDKSNAVLLKEINSEIQKGWRNLDNFIVCDRQVVQSLARERDRNCFLEAELAKRDQAFRQRSEQSDVEEDDSKAYIQELEKQLQSTRAQLLQTKLQLSDQKVENVGLRSQLESLQNNFEILLNENREMENEIERTKSQLETLNAEKIELTEIMTQNQRNQSQESTKHYAALLSHPEIRDSSKKMLTDSHELIEASLLLKIDKQESENYQLKRILETLKDEITNQKTGNSKAQKIIQRLNEKSDQDDELIKQLNQDCSQIRQEHQNTQSKIQDYQRLIQEKDIQYSTLQSRMHDELQGLKDVMHEYQQEFETQKHKLMSQVKDGKNHQHILKDELIKLQHIIQDQERQNLKDLEAKCLQIVEIEDQLSYQQKISGEQISELNSEIKKCNEKYEAQIRYMQKRINDIVQDQYQNQSPQKTNSQSPALVKTLTREMQDLQQEVLQLREQIRSSPQQLQIQKCQEFKEQVIDQLDIWEKKTTELMSLAQKYHNWLDVQSANFCKLKCVISEKDQLIAEFQQQIRARDIMYARQYNQMKEQLELSKQVTTKEFTRTIHLQEQIIAQKDIEIRETEERFGSFKQEFLKVIDERDFLDSAYTRLRDQNCQVEEMYRKLTSEVLDLVDSICGGTGVQSLDQKLPQLKHNFRQKVEHIVELQNLLEYERSERMSDEFKFKQSLQEIEIQLEKVHGEGVNNAAQLRQQFQEELQQLVTELEQQKEISERYGQQLTMRDRQNKKMQQKMEETARVCNQLNEQAADINNQKDEAIRKLSLIEIQLQKSQNESQMVNQILAQTKLLNESIEKEKNDLVKQLVEVDRKYQEATNQIMQLQLALDRQQMLQQTQVQKAQDCDQKLSDIQKDYQSMYNELADSQDRCQLLLQERHKLERDIDALIEEVARKDNQIFSLNEQLHQVQGQSQQIGQQQSQILQKDSMIESLRAMMQDKEYSLNESMLKLEQLKAKKTANSITQTIEIANQDIVKITKLQRALDQVQIENNQLREFVNRMNADQAKLCDEKRELEELILKLNQSINHHKQLSQRKQANTPSPKHQGEQDQMLLGQILLEKDSYITKLEQEITDIRKEMIDSQRDAFYLQENDSRLPSTQFQTLNYQHGQHTSLQTPMFTTWQSRSNYQTIGDNQKSYGGNTSQQYTKNSTPQYDVRQSFKSKGYRDELTPSPTML